jgi:3-dehydroquinate dehydratase / shikimate dehydrogenase
MKHRLIACLMENNQTRICVPVCESDVANLSRTFARANEAGDIVEIRLDCLDAVEPDGLGSITDLIRECDRLTIITLRPAEQGGHRDLDQASRVRFWNLQNCPAAFLDIELDLVEEFASRTPAPQWDWRRIICSHHDFTGVPPDLDRIYERMAATPARVLKIAVRANDVTDCVAVFDLLARSRREGREMIAVAMGNAGIVTRILTPSRGAFLTYGALDDESATAPGQVTAKDLRELYRVQAINEQTSIMGLIGAPVTHSISPDIHNAAFSEAGINAVYIPLEVNDTNAFIKRMVRSRTRELDWNLRGLSVTAPHKTAVVAEMDWLDQAANEIGAVNTIVIEGEQLLGYNTDADALIGPLIEEFGTLRALRCAVIGSGGAASAALWSLRKERANATLFARSEGNAGALAARFEAECASLNVARFDGFDLVINATPLGTRGPLEFETPATARQLRGARLAYDLVYNPGETRFLREAREAGCNTIGGMSMLVSQAAEQFRLWTGTDAPVEAMHKAARRALEANRG